jgi:hypothetical protein
MAYFVLTSVLLVSLAGAMLGRRFSALVLVPAGFLVVVAVGVAVAGTASSAGFWAFMVSAVLGLCCLQLGYFAAVAIGHFNRQSYRASQPELERYGRN